MHEVNIKTNKTQHGKAIYKHDVSGAELKAVAIYSKNSTNNTAQYSNKIQSTGSERHTHQAMHTLCYPHNILCGLTSKLSDFRQTPHLCGYLSL